MSFRPRSSNTRIHIALGASLAVAGVVAVFNPLAGSGDSSGAALTLMSNASQLGDPWASAPEDARTAALDSAALPTPLVARATAQAVLEATAGGTFDASGKLITRDFTLHVDGLVSAQVSPAATVGGALERLGVVITERDWVYPALPSSLEPGAHVYVDHAAAVTLVIGDQATTHYTRAATVGRFLAEVGYRLQPADTASPSASTFVSHGLSINLTTVREIVEYVDEPIGYGTVYEYDHSLPEGEEYVSAYGADGGYERQYAVKLVNGVEVSRELVGEWTTEPTDEVVVIGAYVEPTPAPVVFYPPEGPLECPQALGVYATWYTAASAGGSGTTATGTGVYRGIIAVDPGVIPLGTRMYVPGYGYGVAADTGGGIIGNMIDLGFGDNDVYDWRVGWVEICVLG